MADVPFRNRRILQVVCAIAFLLLSSAPHSAHAQLVIGGDQSKVWTNTKDWKEGKRSTSINTSKEGQIELNPATQTRIFSTPYIYIPNSVSNDLVQLDTETGLKRWQLSLNSVAANSDPSRTTVDINGDVWVGLRGTNKVILVNKEGILRKVIEVGNVPRAITIDTKGHVWVGAYADNKLVRINSQTWKQEVSLKVPCPYGATTDLHGNIWVVSRCPSQNNLYKVSAEGKILGKYKAPGAYGIASDAKGQIWVANLDGGCINRFTNKGSRVTCHKVGGECKHPRGVALDVDGNIWVTCSDVPVVAKFSPGGKRLAVSADLIGHGCVGLAGDAKGHMWVISRILGQATKLDIRTMKRVGTHTTHGIGPYTYSDMTGLQYQHIATSAQGEWSTTFESRCQATWKKLKWTARTPHGTQLTVRARSASTKTKLTKATWGPAIRNGGSPNVPPDKWIEIRVEMASFVSNVSPALLDLTIEYRPKGTEVCNGKDDDCDGYIDNVARKPGQTGPACPPTKHNETHNPEHTTTETNPTTDAAPPEREIFEVIVRPPSTGFKSSFESKDCNCQMQSPRSFFSLLCLFFALLFASRKQSTLHKRRSKYSPEQRH